jgi:hypothetical protein
VKLFWLSKEASIAPTQLLWLSRLDGEAFLALETFIPPDKPFWLSWLDRDAFLTLLALQRSFHRSDQTSVALLALHEAFRALQKKLLHHLNFPCRLAENQLLNFCKKIGTDQTSCH